MIYIALCRVSDKSEETETYIQVKCEAPNAKAAIDHVAAYIPELSWWDSKSVMRIVQIGTVAEIRDTGKAVTGPLRRRRSRRRRV